MDTAEKRLVPLALATAVVAISFAAIFFKKAQPTHPVVMAGVRLTVAALLLSPWTIRALVRGTLRGRALGHAAGAGVFYGLHFGAWVTSLTLTSVAASVTLVTTTPLLLALLGLVTGKDRPGKGVWFALAMAVPGAAMIGGAGLEIGTENLIGDALAVLGAVAMAGYLITGRRLGERLDVLAFSGVATAMGAVVLLGGAAVVGIPVRVASPEAVVYLVLAAALPQIVGHGLLTWCLRHTEPAMVAMAVVGEPVGATILAALWLGESIDALTAAGCALTVLAVVIALRARPPSRPLPA